MIMLILAAPTNACDSTPINSVDLTSLDSVH